MATNRKRPAAKKTQAEINRTKPVGTLSLNTLSEKSTRIIPINVQLPDGEIYRFHHLPFLAERGIEFYEQGDEQHIEKIIGLLSDILVNEDGTPFALADDLLKVDILILTALSDAIFNSARAEGGED